MNAGELGAGNLEGRYGGKVELAPGYANKRGEKGLAVIHRCKRTNRSIPDEKATH